MGADAKGGGGLVSPEVKKWGLRLLLGFAAFYFLLPALLGVSCDLTWNHGKIGCAALKRIEERRAGAADSPGPGFTVNGELNRRMHGGSTGPVRRPVLGRQGLMPSVDCAAMGGIRTTNPNTGMPSCFVPN